MGTLGDLGAGCCGLIEGTGVRRGGLELYCFGSGVLAVSQPVQMNRDLYHTTLISHLTRVLLGMRIMRANHPFLLASVCQ
jgi:hypothetical protein